MRHTVMAALLMVLVGLSNVSAQTARAGSQPAPGAMVNLNTATVAQLEALPGIGRATAERIVEYRQKNGAFKKAEELMNVRGIGEKSFLTLKPLVTVAATRSERSSAGQD